jgi:hypothetical protein
MLVLTCGLSGLLTWTPSAFASPASPSYFASVTEAMKTARLNPEVAPLPDGQVLIAGGHDGSSWLSSAELFDPATDTFASLTEAMTTVRVGAVSSPLPDGQVLIAGGYNGSSWLSSAELFDPATDTFTGLPEAMTRAREAAVAASLPNGDVLIAGGFNGSARLSSAELFDPATGTFTSVAEAMTTARFGAVAAPLPDGQVLIAGGYNDESGYLSSAELFDPATDTFASVAETMKTVRYDALSAPLPDGQVLIAAGETGGGELSSAELFDPGTGTFTSLAATMGTARFGAVAAPLPDGQVLVVGGYSRGSASELSSAELFYPSPQLTFVGGQFGDETVATLSPAQPISISNLGAQSLRISSASLEGADAGDFKIDADGCEGVTLAFRQDCTIAVQFTPAAEGVRQATLKLADNAPEPAAIELKGTGVPAGTGAAGPAGPAGVAGATGLIGAAGSVGLSGATGPLGPRGPAGRPGARGSAVLVTCNTVTATIHARGQKLYTHARRCTTADVAGQITLSGNAAAAHVRLVRGHQVYARGTALLMRNGAIKLLLGNRRPLVHGDYTLILLRRSGGRWITTRQLIKIG